MTEQELKIITNDALKEAFSYEIVPPTLYESIFSSKMIQKGISSKALDEKKLNTFMYDKVIMLNKSAKDSAKELKNGVVIAKEAIMNKDEKSLGEIQVKIEELEKKIDKLSNEIYKDELTKLYNRKWFYDNFVENNRLKDSGTMAFIDINNFKHINDTLGHNVGDQTLIFIATALLKLPFSKVLRYSGDEFIAISYKLQKEDMINELTKINHDIGVKKLKAKGVVFGVDFSFGVDNFEKNEELEKVVSRVDEKMYENKKMTKKPSN